MLIVEKELTTARLTEEKRNAYPFKGRSGLFDQTTPDPAHAIPTEPDVDLEPAQG
jgi:hypothetical protein